MYFDASQPQFLRDDFLLGPLAIVTTSDGNALFTSATRVDVRPVPASLNPYPNASTMPSAHNFGDNTSIFGLQECHDTDTCTHTQQVDESPTATQVQKNGNAHTDASEQANEMVIVMVQNQGTTNGSRIIRPGVNNKGIRKVSTSSKDKMSMAVQDKLALEASAEGSLGAHRKTKQDHNAKERLRRMKLNASYSALSSLIPNNSKRLKVSNHFKKRWSAPEIINRALTYIPELKNEIARMTLEKEKRMSIHETNKKHNNQVTANISLRVFEVDEGNFIIQICVKSVEGDVLSGLLYEVEDEGASIKGASTVLMSNDRICCHLQVEMNATPTGTDFIAVLRDRLASWIPSKVSRRDLLLESY